MANRAGPAVRKLAKEKWESGISYRAVAEDIGYSEPTVKAWKKQEGWSREGMAYEKPLPTEATPYESDVTAAETAPVDFVIQMPTPETETVIQSYDPGPSSEDELRKRVFELELQNSELEAENEELKPTFDVSLYLTDRVAWIEKWLGPEHWVTLAEAEYSKENRKRARDGMPQYDVKNNPDILDQLVQEMKAREQAHVDAPGPIQDPPGRKIKMMIMRQGYPTIEQIPLEGQINNQVGSLADGIYRYTQKGFKMTSPFLCPRAGCFKAAAQSNGTWMEGGYCSALHREEVEGRSNTLPGVTMTDTALSMAGRP